MSDKFLVPDSHTTIASWVVDPKTGMIQGPPGDTRFTFNVKRKLKALELLPTKYPLIVDICKSIGINRRTWDQHLTIDKEFRQRVEEIIEGKTDKVESKLFKRALQDKGTLAQITVMNAYRRARYQPKITIEHEGTITHEHVAIRAEKLRSAVNTSLVSKNDLS